MPKINEDGSIQLTMEEFQQMQAGKSGKQAEGESGSWFDKWKGKLTPKAPEKGNQQQQQQQQKPGNTGGKTGLSREALAEAAKKLTFIDPTPEQLKKIQEGDLSTFLEVQQEGMRRMFVDATMTSNTLVEGSQTASRAEFENMVKEQIGRLESAKTIRDATGDFFQAPGGDVMVSALTRQFKEANPELSAADIGNMVKEYLTDFSSGFGQKETAPSAREAQLQEAQKSATDF